MGGRARHRSLPGRVGLFGARGERGGASGAAPGRRGRTGPGAGCAGGTGRVPHGAADARDLARRPIHAPRVGLRDQVRWLPHHRGPRRGRGGALVEERKRSHRDLPGNRPGRARPPVRPCDRGRRGGGPRRRRAAQLRPPAEARPPAEPRRYPARGRRVARSHVRIRSAGGGRPRPARPAAAGAQAGAARGAASRGAAPLLRSHPGGGRGDVRTRHPDAPRGHRRQEGGQHLRVGAFGLLDENPGRGDRGLRRRRVVGAAGRATGAEFAAPGLLPGRHPGARGQRRHGVHGRTALRNPRDAP